MGQKLLKQYTIVSDPFSEDSFKAHNDFTYRLIYEAGENILRV